MERIELAFAERFAHWGLALPKRNVQGRKRGTISREGWTVQYLFGSDERGEFLDYYATHRMTDDSHVRIYANGEAIFLPTIVSMFLVPPDPVEAEQARQAYVAKNREVAALMAEKGFGLDINGALRADLRGDG